MRAGPAAREGGGWGRALGAALLAATTLAGCTVPVVELEALPAAPIALVYRTLEEGRERADQLKRARGEEPDAGLLGEGITTPGAVERFMERIRGHQEVSHRLRGHVALLDPRTGRVEPLPAFVPGAIPVDWSPSRDRLLVVSPHRGTPQLYQYSLERRDLARLLRGHAPRIGGCYGPDGRLAYVQLRSRGQTIETRIWLTGPGGRGARVYTDGPRDQNPAWSPDGRTLLFESYDERGVPSIRALDPEAEVPVAHTIARGIEPAISPLGDWVVYSREVDGEWRLWRMRPDGTGKSALGARDQGEADERQATISPDGAYVAYVAEEDDRQRIRIRRMDGTGDRLLLEDGDGSTPVWQ